MLPLSITQALSQGGDNAKNVLDHQRRQAHRRFVEDQQARLAEQGAVERQQLLFTAGEQPRQLMLAFGEAREISEDGAHLLLYRRRVAS